MSKETDALLVAMLAKRREDRPQSVREVRERVAELRHHLETGWSAARMERELDGVDLNAKAGFRTHLRESSPGTNTVLVVDDEPQIRRLVALLLERSGHGTAEVGSGEDALMWLGSNARPSAVVLDLMMPGMDGASCLRGMRSLGYRGPVVICTSIERGRIPAQLREAENVAIIDKLAGIGDIPSAIGALNRKAWADVG